MIIDKIKNDFPEYVTFARTFEIINGINRYLYS